MCLPVALVVAFDVVLADLGALDLEAVLLLGYTVVVGGRDGLGGDMDRGVLTSRLQADRRINAVSDLLFLLYLHMSVLF